MITEGKRQFIPREEGDPELTQSEVMASEETKTPGFLRRAGMAAVLGAAMLNAESAPAQELSLVEKQKMEEVRQAFYDERQCEGMLWMIVRDHPVLAPFFKDMEAQESEIFSLKDVKIREADPSRAGKFGESKYYVLLSEYGVLLSVQYNNYQNDQVTDTRAGAEEHEKNMSRGYEELTGSLVREMVKNNLIELKKDSTGEIKIIPNKITVLLNQSKQEIKKDRLDDAIRDVQEVLRIDPKNEGAKKILSYAQELKKAVEDFKK